jgi:hypothetical protein
MGQQSAAAIARLHGLDTCGTLTPVQNADVQAETVIDLKTNQFGQASDTLRLSASQVATFQKEIVFRRLDRRHRGALVLAYAAPVRIGAGERKRPRIRVCLLLSYFTGILVRAVRTARPRAAGATINLYTLDLIQSEQFQHETDNDYKADDINNGVHFFP